MYQDRPTSNITLHATAVPVKKDKFVTTQHGNGAHQSTSKISLNNTSGRKQSISGLSVNNTQIR
jgi:hypothetical protein